MTMLGSARRPGEQRNRSSSRRRWALTLLAIGVVGLGLAAPVGARAEEAGPLPGSCKLHPRHVLPPGCVPAATSELRDPGVTLPNLAPDVQEVYTALSSVLDPETGTVVPGPRYLHFDSWVKNIGTVPLDLTADDPTNPTTARQCVSWTAGRVCRDERVVGGYAWHDEHDHYHFQDFADYRLVRIGADGRPDYSPAGLLAVSEKVSFCLFDATLLSLEDPSAPFYVTCGPAKQGVSPGWADVYPGDTPGQQLVIEGLPDGRYALVVTMDYTNRIHESDDTDNVAEITVDISGNGEQATIVGRNYP